MSKQKRQASNSQKQNERVEDDASGQDMQIEVSNREVTIHEANAIEPIVMDDTTTITTANFHLMTQEEEDLTIKVRKAGDALYDLVLSAIEKAKIISAQKVKEIAAKDISPAAIAAKKDARDIAAVGESVESLARTFESLMTEIRKQPYSEQVHLLTGYKKLLKEQINVIDSRIRMTERLK